MKKLQLIKSDKFTLLDDEEFDRLPHKKWYLSRNGYACTRGAWLHRWILGLNPGDKRQVDHIDGNRLNNQKRNLRTATPSENIVNRGVSRICKSGYKGVINIAKYGYRERPWQAGVYKKVDGKLKRVFYGAYATPEEAARAYDEHAIKIHGPRVGTNFPVDHC